MCSQSNSVGVTYKSLDFLGYPKYQVGDDGSVWSLKRIPTKQLSLQKNRGGYLLAFIYKDGRRWTVLAHRLVLLAFVGPCPPSMECCHEDGDPTNNRADNLRWDSHVNNVGESKTARLTKPNVEEMRRAYAAGEKTVSDIARQYGMNQNTIQLVLRGDSWKHADGPTFPRLKSRLYKISTSDREIIRKDREAGVSSNELASRYGVTTTRIYQICVPCRRVNNQ